MVNNQADKKKADLASSVGAGVLGIGLGILMFRYLKSYVIPILLIGLFLHGWGMFEKRRLEEPVPMTAWWSHLLYWICWVALIVLLVYIVLALK